MTTYFLSYAREDALALRFAKDLIAAGVSVWVDQYDIAPSAHWDRAIETAVRDAGGMIVMLSPRSAASPNVADEVSVALDAGKRVIPIMIQTCVVPLRMTRMQFIDARQDYDSALKRCLAVIASETEPTAAPPPRALAPQVLRAAEQRLAQHMGPIAAVLVRQAAGRVVTEADLYVELSKSLPREADRRGFLDAFAPDRLSAPDVEQPAASNDAQAATQTIKAITAALMRHIGPIAPQLVAREQPLASSRTDLCRRLALRIASAADRAAFLKETGAA